MLVRVADVRFGYRARRGPSGPRDFVLDGVSFAVPEGGLVGILGPNGSGKTTLMKLVSGALALVVLVGLHDAIELFGNLGVAGGQPFGAHHLAQGERRAQPLLGLGLQLLDGLVVGLAAILEHLVQRDAVALELVAALVQHLVGFLLD